MTGAERRLMQLKEQIEQGQQLRYRYEARLEEAARQRERVLQELGGLGVEREALSGEISRLRGEVEALMNEAESLLPGSPVRGAQP